MALSINTHSLLTSVTSGTSTTGTLTASPGDLAILLVFIGAAALPPTLSGGGLTWSLTRDSTLSNTRAVIFTAPVYSVVTAQTITISDASTTFFYGSLFAITNGNQVSGLNLGNSLGTNTMTRTTITGNNGSIVIAGFRAGTDTVISAGATQLDNNATNMATASANSSPFLAGTSTAITATSASSSLISSAAFEVTGANYKNLNSSLRPHPFSPGLAR